MKATTRFTYTSKYASYPNCIFHCSTYTNSGNKYLSISSEEEGPICTCSVNGSRLNAPNEIGIKNYSENEGMVDFLVSMGIIEPTPVDTEHSGWVEIPYFKLTKSGMELFEN